jgi:hypothetical protein
MTYVAYGVLKAVALGFFERLPDRDMLLDDEDPDDADAEVRDIDYNELSPPPAPLVARRPDGDGPSVNPRHYETMKPIPEWKYGSRPGRGCWTRRARRWSTRCTPWTSGA